MQSVHLGADGSILPGTGPTSDVQLRDPRSPSLQAIARRSWLVRVA